MAVELLRSGLSTNVRTIWSELSGRWLAASAAQRAARDYVTPVRCVAPPMLPEPAGRSLRVTVADWPGGLNIRSWGSGPGVLLVHGWGGCIQELDSVVAPVVARGLRAVALDLPGHGRSAGATCHLGQAAEAILAAGRSIGPVRGIFGHGAGAAAAMLALDLGLQAERAVLLSLPRDPVSDIAAAARARGLGRAATTEMMRLVEQRVGRPLAALSLAGMAGRMRIPALLMHAVEDERVPVTEVEGLSLRWTGATLHRLYGRAGRSLVADPGIGRLAAWFLAGGGAVGVAPPTAAGAEAKVA